MFASSLLGDYRITGASIRGVCRVCSLSLQLTLVPAFTCSRDAQFSSSAGQGINKYYFLMARKCGGQQDKYQYLIYLSPFPSAAALIDNYCWLIKKSSGRGQLPDTRTHLLTPHTSANASNEVANFCAALNHAKCFCSRGAKWHGATAAPPSSNKHHNLY